MHPRIQARRESLGAARKHFIVHAIGDLCTSMEFAAGEMERVTGFRPPELTEMAHTYRLVIARLASEQVSEYELAAVSEQVNVSAQLALVFIRTLADKYIDDGKSSTTVN